MSAEIEPDAWVIDDTGFAKFGTASVGVARQYCGALGKVGNCQIGASISAVTPQASCPIDWRLFMPKEWDADPRRAACRVPEEVTHKTKWQLALDMIDELIEWGITPPPVLGDGAYGDVTGLRSGLEQRGIEYVRRQGRHLRTGRVCCPGAPGLVGAWAKVQAADARVRNNTLAHDAGARS